MSKDEKARAKRAKTLFFIVKYAKMWGFCCRRRRGCLSSPIPKEDDEDFEPDSLRVIFSQ